MDEKEQVISREDEGIDLFELIGIFWAKKYFILFMTVICTLGMFIKTNYFTADEFTSTGILYVSNKKNTEAIDERAINQGDIESSRRLTETSIEILKTSRFLEDVGIQAGDLGWKTIKDMVEITAVNETELLEIKVTGGNRDRVYDVATAFMQNAPLKLLGVYKNGQFEVVDAPRRPIKPDSKNLGRNMAIGGVLGFILGAGIVFLIKFIDKRVHRGDDITKRYGIPVLGELAE